MLPWGELLRAALAAGVAPHTFWKLSWVEWRWLTRQTSHPMSQSRLNDLMAEHPDKEETCGGV